MPSASFDLAIIGGGPAGSSAAITAARSGASVVLFEARNFPRHKVCGEFVSAEALDILAELLAEPRGNYALFDTALVIHRTRLWLGTRMVAAAVSPPALSIARYDLDASLWKAAQKAGVDCHAECEVYAAEGDAPFALRTAMGTIAARALIVAAGRWSQFTLNRRVPPGPRYLGLKAHFQEPNPNPSTDLYFFENGYCGVQPVSKDAVNACAMVRSERANSLPQVFGLHPALAARAARWTPLTPAISTAPLIYRPAQPSRGNVAFVGDAAAFIDPFVGDGISIALRSGRLAAQCLDKFLSGESELAHSVAAYQVEYSRQFVPLLALASRVRSLLSWPPLARAAAFELLRLPGVMPLVIRNTRLVA